MTVAVQMHLTLSELEDRYLHASTPVEMRRAHVILLRAEGVASSEVAHITRYSASYISKLVAQFNQDPDSYFRDARQDNGATWRKLLTDDLANALELALKSPPEQGGRWTGPKVARWLETQLGQDPGSIYNQRGWDALKELGYSYKSSRPEHVHAASAQEREAWKKN